MLVSDGSLRWEYADEILDATFDNPRSLPALAKAITKAALDVGLIKSRVPLLGDYYAQGIAKPDAVQAQAKAFSAVINAILEAVHEEPNKVNQLVPKKFMEHRERERLKQLQEKYSDQARAANGDVEPVDVGRSEPIPWDASHEALLHEPDLLETLVRWGSNQIKDMDDLWRATFLALASQYAPPIPQGAQSHWPQADILVIGEISTAKSGFLKLVKALAPQAMLKTAFTPVAFSGRYDSEGHLQAGIAMRANGGVLCVDELDKLLHRFPTLDGLMRSVQTEHHLDYETANGMVDYDTSMLLIAGANPEGDVFGDSNVRRQIPFAEGLLSRYSFIQPLAYSPGKVNSIAGFMADTWFSADVPEHILDAKTIRSMYAALQNLLQAVKRVVPPFGALQRLRDHFVSLQADVLGVPLLVTRDLEAAFKWLNASACLHAAQRTVADGTLTATDADVENAMAMLDATAYVRRLMLSDQRRAVATTPLDTAYAILKTELATGKRERPHLVRVLMERMSVSPATAYRYLDALARRMDIHVEGRYSADVGAATEG